MHMRGSQPARLETATLQAAAYADSMHVQQISRARYFACRLEPELGLMQWRLIRSAWHSSEISTASIQIDMKELMHKGVESPVDLCIV